MSSFAAPPIPQIPKGPAGIVLSPPTTGQPILDGSVRKGVFMDTGTGRPESGMFGNVRRYADGSPRYHEGIDIGPEHPWDRQSDPPDIVRAAAEGLVVYVNRHAYNESLYGNYVVMAHRVPGFGEVYTLYAHLRVFARGLKAGIYLRSGSPLGIMGHTPDFPLARAHVHFEIGVRMSPYYPMIDPQHGIWNGANLYGINPCHAFAAQREKGIFDIAAYLGSRSAAFETVLPARILPNGRRILPCTHCGHSEYLIRATLPRNANRYAVAFSNEGIPLGLRAVADDAPIGQILSWDEDLIQQGRPFVKRGRLTERGLTLLENLTVAPSNPPRTEARMGEVGYQEYGHAYTSC